MRYEPGKTHAWAWPWGRGYAAEYALQGHKRPRYLKSDDGRIAIYPTFQEALSAALTMVKKREPDITAFTAEPESADARIARVIGADTFRERRAAEDRRLQNETFTKHQAGKRPVIVETKRRIGR